MSSEPHDRDRLRVVLPDIPMANTHVTVVAVAERIAERMVC